LYGHDDVHGNDSGDAYTFHYPGDTLDKRNRAQLLRTHDFKMSGITTLPRHLIPSPPVLNSITPNVNGVVVDWRGSAGAASYNLEMTTDGINWQVVKTDLTDTNVPADPLISGATSYELIPVSLDGLLGGASNIVPPLSGSRPSLG
jgi:mannan endo-1,4-beta-mannosidase